MDHNERRVVIEQLKTGPDRILPPASAFEYGQVVIVELIALKQQPGLIYKASGNNDEETIDKRMIDKGPHRMDQNRYPGQEMVLFRLAQVHPGTESGGGNYDCSARGHKKMERAISRILYPVKGHDHFTGMLIAQHLLQPTRRSRTGRPQTSPYLVLH